MNASFLWLESALAGSGFNPLRTCPKLLGLVAGLPEFRAAPLAAGSFDSVSSCFSHPWILATHGWRFNHGSGEVVAVVQVVEFLSLPPAEAYHAARSTAVTRKHLLLYLMQGNAPLLMAARIEDLGMPSNSAAWLGG